MEWNYSRIQKYEDFNFEKKIDLQVGKIENMDVLTFSCSSSNFCISYAHCFKIFLYINQLPSVF